MNEFKEIEDAGREVLKRLIYSLKLRESFITEFEGVFYDCIYKVYFKRGVIEDMSSYLYVMLKREIFRYLRNKRAIEKKNFLLYYNAI